MTPPPLPPRRAWRVALLAVTGAAVAGAVAGAVVYTDRKYKVVLSAGAWRTVLTTTGPVKSAHALIKRAVKKASSKAEPIPVTLTGADWTAIVSGLASRASEKRTPKYWKAADAISSALGSHPHPTMGYERG